MSAASSSPSSLVINVTTKSRSKSIIDNDKNSNKKDEGDFFWDIAMLSPPGVPSSSDDEEDERPKPIVQEQDGDNDDGDNDNDAGIFSSRRTSQTFVLTLSSSSACELKLSSLPLSQGIWSPLGAQAWYGSALLLAYCMHGEWLLAEQPEQTTYLELGSGAVGLVGLALAARLAATTRPTKEDEQHCHHHRPEIILTDQDPEILQQLQVNVDHNRSLFSGSVQVSVQALDWNHPPTAADHYCSSNNNVHLVLGSELIYSTATADACASCIQTLLHQNPKARVVIVQYTERPGWDLFVQQFSSSPCYTIHTEPLRNSAIHDLAQSWIPLGGTLDRYDYGICFISLVLQNNDNDGR